MYTVQIHFKTTSVFVCARELKVAKMLFQNSKLDSPILIFIQQQSIRTLSTTVNEYAHDKFKSACVRRVFRNVARKLFHTSKDYRPMYVKQTSTICQEA